MKARDLIKLLQRDPEAEVVVPASDHSYRRAAACEAKAEVHRGSREREMSEYYDKRNMSDPDNDVIKVFVVM